MKLNLAFVLFVVSVGTGTASLSGCVAPAVQPSSDSTRSSVASSSSTISRYDRFYIASSLTPETLKNFKNEGGVAVIDLREFSEKGECGEAALAAKLDLKFFAAPMPKKDPITKATLADVDRVLAEIASDNPVLLYCSTGNRGAAWLVTYLVRTKNMTVDEAIAIAKTVGLTSAHVEELVRLYLK